MKHLTLLAFLLIPASLFAQAQRKPALFMQQAPYYSYKTNPVKTEGEVFWETSFDYKDPSSPVGYSWPEGWTSFDETDLNMPWIWSADSLGGLFTNLKGLKSHSPEDGWLVLPADAYNSVDGNVTEHLVAAYFQTPLIDCSDKGSVIVKFYQEFISCCNQSYALQLLVSNDAGTHWSTFDCSFGTAMNEYAQKNEVSINISEIAAGMDQVSLRFRFADASHYFWAIDDLRLSEAYQDELILEDHQASLYTDQVENDEGFLCYLPWTLLEGSAFGQHTFWGALLNDGINDQEDVALQVNITKNGSDFYAGSSDPTRIRTLERETLFTNDPVFQPDGYGDYHMNFLAVSENTEQDMSNNKAEYYLTVNDSIYSRCDDSAESYQSTSGWLGGNNDGDQLGVVYELTKPLEINSLSVYISSSPGQPGMGTRAGMECMYWVWQELDDKGWIPVIASDIYTLREEDLNNWLTLGFDKNGNAELLDPGRYMATIQTWHGGGLHADNNLYRFTIGDDHTYYSPASKNTMLLVSDELGWNSTGKLNMIRMNFNETGGPSTANVTFNVDMNEQISNSNFTPASDFVDIVGTFNNWMQSENLSDIDGDGIYSITLPEFPVFKKIEYKYRINGNWDTAEFMNGEPNREFMVRYLNSSNDLYNNKGNHLESNTIELDASIQVFPNPNQGIFTVSVKQSQAKDLSIQVVNIHGQDIYSKSLPGILDYQEQISMHNYPKGLYFLKVNHQVIRIVVQ